MTKIFSSEMKSVNAQTQGVQKQLNKPQYKKIEQN